MVQDAGCGFRPGFQGRGIWEQAEEERDTVWVLGHHCRSQRPGHPEALVALRETGESSVRQAGWKQDQGCFEHGEVPGFLSTDVYKDDSEYVAADEGHPASSLPAPTPYYLPETSRGGESLD